VESNLFQCVCHAGDIRHILQARAPALARMDVQYFDTAAVGGYIYVVAVQRQVLRCFARCQGIGWRGALQCLFDQRTGGFDNPRAAVHLGAVRLPDIQRLVGWEPDPGLFDDIQGRRMDTLDFILTQDFQL